MPAVLAADLGKSGCRAALWLAGDQPVAKAAGPGTPGLAAESGEQAAEAAIGELYRQLLATTDLAGSQLTICVGAAGALAAPAAADRLAERLRGLAGVTETVVCSDAVIAHAGALAGGPGITLVAGTGAVAFGIDPSGRAVQVDGWGPQLGDTGSGGWIGLAGLRAALRDQDGRGPATALGQAASLRFGDLSGLPAQLASQPANPAQFAATFAPDVARHAGAGDPVAGEIIAEAAEQLAASVIAAAARFEEDPAGGAAPVPLVLVGGLLQLGAVLLDPLHAALRRSPIPLAVQPARAGPLEGGRLLATRRDTVAERLLHRASGAPRGTPGPAAG
jgi:N-acetylglucosamine kinase-like BadF-type ATPase